jgi:hypothetical protein
MTLVAILLVLVIVGVLVGGTLLARSRGYNVGGAVVVRCREGHLFTTVWLPGVSFKAIKLGWVRFQRCPVGGNWTFVTPVKDAELSEEERLMAARYRDSLIP